MAASYALAAPSIGQGVAFVETRSQRTLGKAATTGLETLVSLRAIMVGACSVPPATAMGETARARINTTRRTFMLPFLSSYPMGWKESRKASRLADPDDTTSKSHTVRVSDTSISARH